jgi:hypothetical protein
MFPLLVALALPGQRLLNYGNLVNWDAPLNRGLVSWWLQLPQLRGGPKLFDIAGRNHGTLTNGPTWGGSLGRPGQFGALAFSGSNYVALSQPIALTGALTIQFGIRWTAIGSAGVLLGGADPNYFPYIDATNIYIRSGVSPSSIAHGGITDGVDYTITITCDGTNAIVYKDTTSLGSILQQTPTVSAIGSFSDGTVGVSASIFFLKYWTRQISAAEVASGIQDSRQGYPATLNWIRRPVYGSAAAATSQGHLLRYRRMAAAA